MRRGWSDEISLEVAGFQIEAGADSGAAAWQEAFGAWVSFATTSWCFSSFHPSRNPDPSLHPRGRAVRVRQIIPHAGLALQFSDRHIFGETA